MIGTNTVSMNMGQVKKVFEDHLKDELFKDGDFRVSDVSFDYQTKCMNITLSEPEKADGLVEHAA